MPRPRRHLTEGQPRRNAPSRAELPETHVLRDPKAMRAMAHPVRLQVWEILRDDGPLTATELGERIGESPTNTAFHLRTLGKYGFVQEAEKGKGRARPWRSVPGGLMVREEEPDGEARRAAAAMVGALRAMLFRQIERWAAERAGYPKKWQAGGFEMEFRGTLTAPELARVGKQINEVLAPYRRSAGDAPAGAKKVTIAAWGFPTEPPDEASPRRNSR